MIRKPIVAGQFYQKSESLLKKEVAGYTTGKKEKINALGVISPHAGFVYSGPVAGHALSSITPKSTYIILGPNHTGRGLPFGLDPSDAWETPLGEVKINKDLAENILSNSRYIKKDSLCHAQEHSIEVQLPFLQYLNKDFNFVPIVISSADGNAYKDIGSEIARTIKDIKNSVAIIASSDMTHYEPHESAIKKDKIAIDKILALDIDGFLDTIERYNISMCGFAPIAVMMQAATLLGAKHAKLLKYNTSGDTSGDYSAVVGYAGMAVY